MQNDILAIVLAAGEGTRMKSVRPKVVHEILGKAMIDYVIEELRDAGVKQIGVVLGFKAEEVRSHIAKFGDLDFFYQDKQMGSAHALLKCGKYLDAGKPLFVMCGDTPFLKAKTISGFINFHTESGNDITVMTAHFPEPFGYGRIVKEAGGGVVKIVEERDASDEERKIKEINSGIYCFKNTGLMKNLKKITPNNVKEEYYLTDIVELTYKDGGRIGSFSVEDSNEIMGINSREQLINAEEILKFKMKG